MKKDCFISPKGVPTREMAENLLKKIRKEHFFDWIVLDSYFEERSDGWHVVCIYSSSRR